MYIGETKAGGQTLRHIHIWNTVVARAGWEACQIAYGAEDVQVHHNVFDHAGLGGLLWQDNNFQLSANSTGDFHHNIVIGATSNLVIAFGGRPKNIHDNYFEGTVTGPAVSLADSNLPDQPDTTFTLERNFFRGVRPVMPIVLFTGVHTKVVARDNVWEGENRFIRYQPLVDLSAVLEINDNVQRTVARPEFVDPEHGDYRLKPDDPYRKLGFGLLPE
jgi:hypothetical protein